MMRAAMMSTTSPEESRAPRPWAACLSLALIAILPFLFLPPKALIAPAGTGYAQGDVVTPNSAPGVPGVEKSFAARSEMWIRDHLGGGPRPQHLVDLAMHAGAALLLFGLSRRLGGGRFAWTAAALFALHPALVDAVSSVYGRGELLLAIAVAAALFFQLDTQETKGRAVWRPIATCALFAFGGFAKDAALVLALLPAAVDALRLRSGELSRSSLRGRVPLWLGAPAGALLGAFAGGLAERFGGASFSLDALAASTSILPHAWRLVVFPVGLCHDYGPGTLAPPSALSILGGLALASGLLALAFAAFHVRGALAPAVGTMLALGALLFAGLPGAERLFSANALYLPLFGVFVVLAWFASASARSEIARGGVLGVAALLGVVFLALGFERGDDWLSPDRLNAANLAAHPSSINALAWSASAAQRRGDFESQLSYSDRLLAFAPDDAAALLLRGEALFALERDEEALVAARRVARGDGAGDARAWRLLGRVALRSGELDEAVEALGWVHRREPDDAKVARALARALVGSAERALRRGHRDEALASVRRAVETNALPAEGLVRAGLLLAHAGARGEARPLLDRALELDATLLRRRHEAAIRLGAEGKHEEAARLFAEIVALRPEQVSALFNLGRSLMLAGRPREAIAPLRRGLALREDPGARNLLRRAQRAAAR